MDLYPLTAITAVLGAMLTVLWWIQRRSRQSAQPDPIQRTRQIVLTPQHRLHVVQFGGRDLLVATHPQGCALLGRRRARTAQGRTPAKAGGAQRADQLRRERRADQPAPADGLWATVSGLTAPFTSPERGPLLRFGRPEARHPARTAGRGATAERALSLLAVSRPRNGALGPVPVEGQR